MAQQGILWQLVSGFNPGAAYTQGLQQYNQQQNILQQLAGQEQDRQLRRDQMQQSQSNADRQFNFGVTQAERQQANADRAFNAQRQDTAFNQAHQNRVFGLQEQTANTAQITTYEMPDGTKVPVRVDRQGNATAIVPQGIPQSQPNNPFANGKLTESQAKEAAYADRMARAHLLLNNLENVNQGPTGYIGGQAQNILPEGAINSFVSADRQARMQAERGFINALLRRESGAVINPSEFVNYAREYFPQPGDGPEIIAQKRQARQIALEGLMRGAGTHYRPPAEYLNYRQQQNPNNPNPQATTNPPLPNQPKTQISSQAEYDRLPSGSLFIMNGKSYQKP